MALTGQGLADFAKSKVGTPYVYGAKLQYGTFTTAQLNSLARSYPNVFTSTYIAKAKQFVGKVCTDCSGLISGYTKKLLGSAQMYSTASRRIPISDINSAPVGAVVWKSGHVGVYLGNGKVAEAKGINYGTIISNVSDTSWKYALLFDYISYSAGSTAPSQSKPDVVVNGKNPYAQPVNKVVSIGSSGTSVKWVQWELQEAGYDLNPSGGIDGKFGAMTERFVIDFQKLSKLDPDGKVGNKTQKALIANKTKAANPYTLHSSLVVRGNIGENVKWVQWELQEAGYDLNPSGGIDGKFGAMTERFVMDFQRSSKLDPDGKVGSKTKKALIAN